MQLLGYEQGKEPLAGGLVLTGEDCITLSRTRVTDRINSPGSLIATDVSESIDAAAEPAEGSVHTLHRAGARILLEGVKAALLDPEDKSKDRIGRVILRASGSSVIVDEAIRSHDIASATDLQSIMQRLHGMMVVIDDPRTLLR